MTTVEDIRTGSGWRLAGETVRQQRGAFAKLLAWSFLQSVPVLFSGALVAKALDRGFLRGDFGEGALLLGTYALLVVIGGFGARQAVEPLATIVESMRFDLITRTVTASLRRAVHDEERVDGRNVEAATKHTDTLRMLLSQLLVVLRTAVFSLVFAIVGLFFLAPLVAWTAVAGTVFVALVLVVTARGWQRRVRESLLAEERLSGNAATTMLGLRDVIACGAAERAERDLSADVDAHARAALLVGRLVAGRVAIISIGGRLPLAVLLLAAPAAISGGGLTPGELLGAATYLIGTLDPMLRSIVRLVGEIGLQLGVLFGRILEYSRPSTWVPPELTATSTGGALALRGVSFGYSASSERVLDRVDLDVAPGERLVVVGPSGAGKSTMANLLAGLDRPQRGEVLLGGTDVGSLEQTGLRRRMVLLPQEAYVFSGSVRENLAYLNPDATDADLDAACHAVGADELVAARGGIDGRIDAPNELSEGQKQLITLARAYACPADVVVLDEATCHLHPERERQVEEAFAATGRTLVIIAHRMSSAMRADRVALLHEGTLSVGTHEQLRNESPLYADLIGYWNEV